MDRTLTFSDKILDLVNTELENTKDSFSKIQFKIWTDIPKSYLSSYYENEQIINPVKTSFEDWISDLDKRQNPIFSVALDKNIVVSSIYGAGLTHERSMNLWATKTNYRQKGIGKIVLLNFVRYCLENYPEISIRAWDVTSQQVDSVLTDIGFT